MSNFKTVYEEAESLDVIKKSKFIGYVKPIESVDEANAFIESIKKKHWDANHNVPVYVLGDRFQIQKYSDDGEPSGTAGVPVLNMLKNENITNVVVVITRYFGGIKLGTGGLVRAYTQSAKSALEAGKVIEMIAYQKISVSMNYTLFGKFQNYLANNKGYFIVDTIYTDDVTTELYVMTDELDVFEKQVIEMTNANVVMAKGDEDMLPISNNEWIRS